MKFVNTERQKKLLLFLISPFLSFLYSLRHMNTRSSFMVFYGIAICFGMAFSVKSSESISGMSDSIDAIRYKLDFEEKANMTSKEFYENLNNYLNFDDGDKDFYYTAMVYLVSRFTNNYHWLFMAFAFVFVFFQLKTLKFLVEEENWNNGVLCIILAVFFTWNQIFNINAMRFYTAAWVTVYVVFQIFIKDKKNYLLLLVLTPLFHHSYILITTVIFTAFLLRKWEWFWIVLLTISFSNSTVLADYITTIAAYLPDILAKTAIAYTDTERLYIESTFSGSGFWWVPMVFDRLYKIYTNILIIVFIINRKIIIKTKCKNIYIFVIALMTFVNFSFPIPELGSRSIVMVYPIIAYIWLSCFGTRKYNWLIYIFPLIWTWQIITYVNYYTMVLDFDFFVTSPIYMVVKYLILQT